MTTPQWPFVRAFVGGLVLNDVPQPEQLNLLDEQVSRAADGTLYNEALMAKNLEESTTETSPIVNITPTSAIQTLYCPFRNEYYFFFADSTGGSHPLRVYTSNNNGRKWLDLGIFSGLGGSSTSAPECVATNGAGVSAMGFGVFSGDQSVVYSTDGWNNHTLITMPGGFGSCKGMYFSQRLGLWIFVSFNGAIFTSTVIDGAKTFRYTIPAGAASNCHFAESGSKVLLVSFDGTHSAFFSTADGVTWAPSPHAFTLTTNAVRLTFVQAPLPGTFVAIHSGASFIEIGVSVDDGATWATTTNAGIPAISDLRCYNHMVYGSGERDGFRDLWRSFDNGQTWKRSGLMTFTASGPYAAVVACAGDGMLIFGLAETGATLTMHFYRSTVSIGE